MSDRRDSLLDYDAKYGKDRLFANNPQRLKDELLGSGIKPSEAKVIVDITTDYGRELSVALRSNDDSLIINMRNRLLQETEWRPETLSSILYDLYFVFSRKNCNELLNAPTANNVKMVDGRPVSKPPTVSGSACISGLAPSPSSKKIAEGKSGEMIWELYDDGLLIVSGKGEATDSGTWRRLKKSIKRLDIREGITSINAMAFDECTLLTEVRIAPGVADIGDGAFQHCSSLKTVDISEGVVSIGAFAFDRCASLTHVTIPRSVVSIDSYAFTECKKLKSIDLPAEIIDIDDDAFSDWTVINRI